MTEDSERRNTDAAMLDSLAVSFDRWFDGGPFEISFNAADVADLMRRASRMLRADDARDEDATETLDADEYLAFGGLRAAQRLAHKTAEDAGWYKDPDTGKPIKRNFGEVVALMHSELSEALEADRKGLKDDKLPHRDGREVEFADCIIRILDTAEAERLDVAGALIEKNRFNRRRTDHRLEARAKNGGKKY